MGEYLERFRTMQNTTIPELEAALATAEAARQAAVTANYTHPGRKSEAALESATTAATKAKDLLEGARSTAADLKAVAKAEHRVTLDRLEQEAQAAREAFQDGELLQRPLFIAALVDLIADFVPNFPSGIHGGHLREARKLARPPAEGSPAWLWQRRMAAAAALERHRKIPPELAEG